MVQGKWIRRAAWTAGTLLALWVVTWLAVPPLLMWQAPQRLSAAFGRPVTLGSVDFHPWSLELVLHDLAVGPAAGASAPPLLRVARVRANVALSSIVRRAPVVEAIDIDQARIALARTAAGHYDIDDLLQRFAAKPGDKPSEPARFALYNLQVRDLGLRFDDRPEHQVHVVEALNLSLPFLSNLPAKVDIVVEPHLAFRLNGAAFDSGARATPFAADDRGDFTLALRNLDLRPYLGYLPDTLPVRLTGGALSSDLKLTFAKAASSAPTVSLGGWLEAGDVAVTNAAGTPLVSWKTLRVDAADLQPLAHKLAFSAVKLTGAQWHLDRDANGDIDALRTGPTPATSAPAATRHAAASTPAVAASAVTPAPAAPWQVRVATLAIADSRILWNDASTHPAAALAFDGLTLDAKALQWPGTAPAAFTLAANVAGPAASAASGARLVFDGHASTQDAQVAITLSDLSLQALAPYLAQALVPRVDGRLAAKGSVTWSGKAEAPALKIALASATLDALRVQPAGAAPAASWEQFAVSDLQLDVPGRSVSIADVKLLRPNVQVARGADGQVDAAQWLRASPAASAPAPAASAAPPSAPWHVQVRRATLDDGLLQFADASLHPEQHLPPLRAELRQLRLDVQDFAWFGDRPVPPARVTLDARIGRPALAGSKAPHGGELGWKGTLGLSPLAANGSLRVVRFPVALVTPWVAERLPVSLLRAEAGYTGHLELQAAPTGLSVSTSGDALIGDVHFTTLAAAAPASTAASAVPDELLGWQSLSLKGLKFVQKPPATPRLDIAQVELDDLFAKVLVTEQGRLNLQDIGATPPDAAASAPQVAAAASAPAPAASAAPLPIVINVGGIKLVNGRVDYTDHFVRPNYSAALTELNGSLGAFSSTSRDMAALQLHGRAEGTALLDIAGQVNPLARPLALDIEAKATDLELAPLTPYAGKYAGYAIERGKLSMDVAYKIAADGQLEARNQVILNQLTFGDPIASPSATKLPVRLAVALLKDRNGVIDINLPISGSVNDPQFSVGGIVLKLIGNLLLKAVTSPFSLLTGGGGSGGADGPDMSAIEFRPGTAVVTDSSAAALDKMAAALAERPSLQMTITGSADLQAERADLQREAIEAQLRTLARDDALRAGESASAAASAPQAVTPAARSALLKTLYKLTRLPNKPRVLGFAKDLPDAEMESMLRANVAVTDETVRQQALARAIAVRDALIAKGVSSDRLFLAAPSLHAAGADATPWKPQATLALTMP